MQMSIVQKYQLDKLYRLIGDIENEVIKRVNANRLLGKKDDIDLLVPALIKSTSTLRQIIILCENGFPDGALILARTIYEQMVICSFIESFVEKEDHDECLTRYFQDAELTRLKYLIEASKRFRQEPETTNYEKMIGEHKKKYGSTYKTYWWAEVNSFRELSDVITNRNDSHHGLVNNLHLEYKIASILIHPSSFSNLTNIGANHGVVARPRNTGHENALFLAVGSIIPIVGDTYQYLQLNEEYVIKELNHLGIFYLEMLIEKTDVNSKKETVPGKERL